MRRCGAACAAPQHLFCREEDSHGVVQDGEAAHSEHLKAAFEKHEGETEEHVARLEQVFTAIGAATANLDKRLFGPRS
jgi:hypothetical protein